MHGLFSKAGPGADFFGNVMQPQGANDLFGGGFAGATATTNGTSSGQNSSSTKQGQLVTGDLDASLANLTSNLNLAAGQGR